jgi:phosphoglycerate dehydrogenase-like enzyme
MIRSLEPGAWVVNTSRGSVVDEAALAEAVVSGHIAGVAVDVLDGEGKLYTSANELCASNNTFACRAFPKASKG